jgi:hypothetical protein
MESKKLVQSGLDHYKQRKESIEQGKYINFIEVLLYCISGCYVTSDILKKSATSVMSESSMPSEDLAVFYNTLCQNLMDVSHYDYAKACGEISYGILKLDPSVPDHIKYQVIYNLALSFIEFDHKMALKYLTEAEKNQTEA